MRMRRSLFTVLSLFAGMLGNLVWWEGTPPAHAAGGGWNTTLVSVTGTVSGQPEESVVFSGQAKIRSKVARDPKVSSKNTLVTYIDLSSVSGVGSSTMMNYVISSPGTAVRPLAASDVVEFVFPFYPSGTTATSTARSGVASFQLSFDLDNGAITSATGSISSPDFPQ